MAGFQWNYTAPIDDLGRRRADPLGFRTLANEIADALAPDLSSATWDGRWLSIVCWILVRSQKYIADQPSTRKSYADAYEWIRPAELLWVAASLKQEAKLKDKPAPRRSLPQRRAVAAWDTKAKTTLMGLSGEAWQRYRYAGPYGTWRAVLKSLGLTQPDGLTIQDGGVARKLAEKVQELMPADVEPFAKKSKSSPTEAWCTKFQGWKSLEEEALPSDRDGLRNLAEAKLLRDLIFKKGSRRLEVIKCIKGSKPSSFAQLAGRAAKKCANLDGVKQFTEFSNAAMGALDCLSQSGMKASSSLGASYEEVAKEPQVKASMDELRGTATNWLKTKASKADKYLRVTTLAKGMQSKNIGKACRLLVEHHDVHHDGRAWLVSSGSNHFHVIGSGGGSSMYTYRLYSLMRLGVQAGVLGKVHTTMATSVVAEESDDE